MKKSYRVLFNLLAVLSLVASIIACGSTDPLEPVESDSSGEPSANATDRPAESEPVAEGQPGTWLIMMYEDADDEVLEEDIVIDLNEAELVGSNDRVTIVAQLDRYVGGYAGHGDETSTKRYLLTRDADLNAINSEELEDLGEADMGDPNTLIDFATWAMQTYPADNYVLILSDHGGGWDGGWSDDDPYEGSKLSMQSIDEALGTILANTGVDAFELIGFDACLMGQLEVMSVIAPHARYAVGSEETEPSLGWAYGTFLQALVDDPSMTGRELGQAIVDSYIDQDIRITDDAARSNFVGEGYSASDVAAEFGRDVTLTAVDLRRMQDLNAALNDLSVALTYADQGAVAEARAYAQSYTSIFGDEEPPSYIDLGHFLDLLQEMVSDPDVQQAADQVKSALAQAVVAEKHGPERPGSSGLTVFFPNSDLYQGFFSGEANYTSSVGRFVTASLWDDFLTFHYVGEPFDSSYADLAVLTPAESSQTDFTAAAEESAPESGAEVVAPGIGEITIEPITLSADQVAPGGSITMSTEITGSNIGYVYYYVAYYDEESASYLTADMGFIAADETMEVGGVYYPDWGDEGVSIEFDWEPVLYYMSDGIEANDQFAFFEPTVYGVDIESDVYTVRGYYTFTDSGNEVEAEMDFNGNGEMLSVFGFNGEDGSGAPHEITPRPGDTFTIYDEWLEFENNPDGEFTDYIGGTMTFGEQPFVWQSYYAFSGSYTIGIVVSDLNGNYYAEFVEVFVTE